MKQEADTRVGSKQQVSQAARLRKERLAATLEHAPTEGRIEGASWALSAAVALGAARSDAARCGRANREAMERSMRPSRGSRRRGEEI